MIFPPLLSSLLLPDDFFGSPGDRTEAKFQCNECKTLQCEVCEELLHENPRFDFHERSPLKPTPPELICQNSSCTDRNFADWYCKECQSRLCSVCDSTVHSGSPNLKKHSKEVISWQQNTTTSNNKSNSSASDLPPNADNHSLPNGKLTFFQLDSDLETNSFFMHRYSLLPCFPLSVSLASHSLSPLLPILCISLFPILCLPCHD